MKPIMTVILAVALLAGAPTKNDAERMFKAARNANWSTAISKAPSSNTTRLSPSSVKPTVTWPPTRSSVWRNAIPSSAMPRLARSTRA